MNACDAIVIGSGIGGLSAALELQNQGQKVLLLERALDFGGYSNPFKRKKFHFDPGIHYLGELNPGQSFHETLRRMGVLERLSFDRIPDDCYDRYIFPDLDFRMPSSRPLFQERLVKHFPDQRQPVQKYLEVLNLLKQDIYSSEKSNPFAALRALDPELGGLRKMTYGKVLDHIFGEAPLLKAVLSGPCGDIGLPPGRVAATAMFGIMNHYIDGAYFPHGGSGALRDAFVSLLTEKGAVLKNRTEVKAITVENGRTTGVRTESGEIFQAPIVVSAVDPVLTFQKFLPADIAARNGQKVLRLENSYASLCLFIATDLAPEKIRLQAENIWHYPDTNIDQLYSDLTDPVPETGDFPFFLSVPSRKDRSGRKCPPGTEILEMVVLADPEPWMAWDGMRAMQRGPEYNDRKTLLAKRMLRKLEETYAPGISDHILVQELATPVTNSYYTAAHRGAIYGPAHTVDQTGTGRFLPRTSIKGLYLAGSAVFGCGIAPCSISGYLAATLALKER